MSDGLSIERSAIRQVASWKLAGAFDLATLGAVAAVLETELLDSGADVWLDVAQLHFIGFAALDLLVELSRHLAARGRRLLLTPPTTLLQRAAHLAEIDLQLASDNALVVPPRASDRVPAARRPRPERADPPTPASRAQQPPVGR